MNPLLNMLFGNMMGGMGPGGGMMGGNPLMSMLKRWR